MLLAFVLSSPLLVLGALVAMQCFERWMLGPDTRRLRQSPVRRPAPPAPGVLRAGRRPVD
jgi:hypothetical protein